LATETVLATVQSYFYHQSLLTNYYHELPRLHQLPERSSNELAV